MDELVQKARDGDSEAFAELMRSQGASLYRVARCYLDREADREDAVQSTLLTCWERLGELQRPGYFKTWMTRILINHCLAILRGNRRIVPMDELPEEFCDGLPEGDLDFENMMRLLSGQNRAAMTLFYAEGLPVRKIAQLLNISEASVRQRLHRGRKELEKHFVKEDGIYVFKAI